MTMKKYQAALLLSATLALTVTATGCGKTTTDGVRTNQRGTEARMLNTDNRTHMYDDRMAPDRMNTRSMDRVGQADRYRGYSGTNMDRGTDGMRGMGMNDRNMVGMNDRGTNGNGNNDRALEDKLARHATGVKGVDKATVVVYDDDVLVGIDVKPGENSASVARQVKRSLERAEKGYDVHVTTDKKYHSRIMDMHTNMMPMDGHPIRDFSHDVGVLIRDIGRTVTAPFR